MNKKLITILVAVIILAGGAFFFWNQMNSSDNNESEQTSTDEKWNPYETANHHQYTLSDFLISANEGKAVVKMSITLDFLDDTSYIKFKGYSSIEESKKSSDEGHGTEGGTVTPMELKINDTIGVLMMKATEEHLKDKELLKTYLLDGINNELDFKTPLIKDLYIENLIIQ